MKLSWFTEEAIKLFVAGRPEEAHDLMVGLTESQFAQMQEEWKAVMLARLALDHAAGRIGGPKDGSEN